MSEPKKKIKPENKKSKRKVTNNNNTNVNPPKKFKFAKRVPDDGIAKSKQLAQKLRTTRSSSYGRPKTRSANKDDEPRLCGNGMPMPSLSELEKMFEDSDGDDEPTKDTPSNDIVKPSTPKKNPKLKEKLMSPTTITEIANRMLHLVSNISDPTELLEDAPPPRVIKPKKRKKPDEPYIVGCKDRPRVPEKPTIKFCKGDDKYGPDSSESEEDIPTKRAKRGKKINLSKSIFNAKSDEIAARLKECEKDGDSSSDSNKTVAYEYYTPINNGRPRSFSPLPSTSTDNETIVKNDQRFNESLISENNTESVDEVKILEAPCEIIEIIETTSNRASNLNGSIIEIKDDGSTQILDDKSGSSNTTNSADDQVQVTDDNVAHNNASNTDDITASTTDDDSTQKADVNVALDTAPNTDDDSVQIVPANPSPNTTPITDDDSVQIVDVNPAPNTAPNTDDDNVEVVDTNFTHNSTANTDDDSVLLVDDYYGNLDIEIDISDDNDNEVIDVDDIIAQNNAILKKYSNTNSYDTVTLVDVTNIQSPAAQNNQRDEKNCSVQRNRNDSTTQNNNDANSNRNNSELPSVIVPNTAVTQRPTVVRNRNKEFDNELEFIGTYPNQANDEVHRNPGRNETIITINHDNVGCPSGTTAPNHINTIDNNRRPLASQNRCQHQLTTVLRSPGDRCDYCHNPPTSTDYDNPMSQEQLQIIGQFFERRRDYGDNNRGGRRPRRGRKGNNMLNMSQHFMTWLESMTNNDNSRNGQSNITQTHNDLPSPGLSNNDTPDKPSKRIGDCPICMDSLSSKPIASTICGHVFCMNCLKLSIRSNGSKCPTCRKVIKKGGFHQIFL
ncbi:GATA zinc finger domain-containing protein 14-like [Ostrinia furnacalis]|uniref:GATA zinc finger domain-containing protein 14-like n=1 Tax=Ostrinia furnacalis TaxID=93504 RepID=UPI001040BDCE|nr:GATA zinc finger domain-containing protein 14-like [Ostrinia furnacalis]